MRQSLISGIALLASVAAACSAPASYETFVPQADRGEDGRYSFTLMLDDSSSVYSISFYTRIDSPESSFMDLRDLPFEIELVSPAGASYSETVYMDIAGWSDSGYFTKGYDFPYRLGLVPSEYGRWEMSVKVDGEESVKGFRGLGLRVDKEDSNRNLSSL